MGCSRLARSLFGTALLLVLGPGCQALHIYRPVTILAKDAETGKPIPNAEVRISYPYSSPQFAPWDSVNSTGDDGIVHLRAAPSGDFDLALTAKAKDYLTEEKSIPVQTIQALKPAHPFETVAQRPVDFVMELYKAEPEPTVELVIPTGYRGVVEVEVHAQEELRGSPGQRRFRYEVPPSGVVQLTGPALLQHVWCTDYSASYADGTPLRGDAKEQEVGFWLLQSGGRSQTFFVGTAGELASRTRTEGSAPARPQGGKGGRGHGGRRNRNGNQPPSDAGFGGP